MKAVNIVLNVIWLIIWGLWMAIGYALLGLLMFIFIITIPWGIASLRIANYVLWPFGRTTVERRDAGVGSLLGNIIWLVLAGIWLAIGHVIAGIGFCLTIIGIPFGIANFKMVPISLVPLGREIVPVEAPYATR
ncbi:YccF domain-containing protein [Actinacidiphila glaucinigra]|uniref:YccF domain-containing protein n=1 Tax=Actinacidiphila glaucinigra TaxID=235986 RepID=UPI002DD8F3FE|nr:YccF domain-containing protein [Actinacidiphila glaucinigra]WSD60677.1 YccF domain-containing protein [Actinacidiphila glaucinigra]